MPGAQLSLPEREEIGAPLIEDRAMPWAVIARLVQRDPTTIARESLTGAFPGRRGRFLVAAVCSPASRSPWKRYPLDLPGREPRNASMCDTRVDGRRLAANGSFGSSARFAQV